MKTKTKVIFISEVQQLYREPIFRIMNEKVDLTLAYTVRSNIKSEEIKIIKFPNKKIGPFHIHYNIYDILNKYDVVILLPHLNFISLNWIAFLPHKFKLVTWTIGVHATYDTPYDLSRKPSFKDWCFQLIQNRADACIFYMPGPIQYWKKYMKIDESKYFVAHNTVAVAEFGSLPPFINRNSFLFVGTLYRQKGISELIEAYKMANEKSDHLPILNIVGDGPEKDSIKQQIYSLGLENKIFFLGPIYEEEELKNYFLEALLCISPKQAGLSVCKSLGYGCPFVTRPDAITGGERDNIINGFNGFFYSSVEQLSEILINASNTSEQLETISTNARNYYQTTCHPRFMANGAIEAINYALEH